jgi:hypothetical protein
MLALTKSLAKGPRGVTVNAPSAAAPSGVAAPSIVVIGDVLALSYGISALAGGTLCFGLRFTAIRRGWAFGQPGILSAAGTEGGQSLWKICTPKHKERHGTKGETRPPSVKLHRQ